MDYAHYKTVNTVASVRLAGLEEIAVYGLNWSVMILSTMIRVSSCPFAKFTCQLFIF